MSINVLIRFKNKMYPIKSVIYLSELKDELYKLLNIVPNHQIIYYDGFEFTNNIIPISNKHRKIIPVMTLKQRKYTYFDIMIKYIIKNSKNSKKLLLI